MMIKCRITVFLFFLLLAAALINPAYAATIEVYPGESIQSAINEAVSGDTVFLFSGTYAEDIVMKDGVRIEGEAYNQVEIYGTVLFKDASSTLKDVTIVFPQSNFTSYTNTYYIDWQLTQDAGITAINSSPTIQNCVIKPDLDNIIPEVGRYGNGIQIWNMYQNPDIAPQIEGNLIQDTDCGIYYFSQAFGGAINGKIKSNTLYNNGYGVILRMHKENPEIVNNIIVNGAYAGIFLAYRDDPLFDARKSNIHYNDIWNNFYNYWLDSDGAEFDLTGINSNISGDPVFEDAENGDFRLDSSSPCIGQGTGGEDIGGYATAPLVVSQEAKAYQFLYEMMDKYYKKNTNFKIKVNDVNYPYGTYGVDITGYVALSDTWQEVNIPFSDFTSQGIDLTRLTAVSFTFDNLQAGGTIYIDDVKFKKPSPDPGSILIDDFEDGTATTNSMGYWTNDDGTCVFSGDIAGTRKLEWDSVNDYWYTVVYDGETPLDASSYDRLSFKIKQVSWNDPRLVEDYAPTDTRPSIYTATIRETAQAIIALLARGTSDDITRAHILANTLKYCQEHDPTFTDGRIRDAYWSTNLMDESTGNASVKSPDSTSSNLAWALLAFIQDYEIDTTAHADMLTAATNLAAFIDSEYKDATNPGFVYGYTGWEGSQVKQTYKSTENNAVLYTAFKQLYDITQNSTWYDDAIWAKRYLEEITWNDSDKMFFSGTKDDGITVNTFNPTIDADTIPLLALGSDYPLTQIDGWVEANYATTYGVFSGYDYNQDRDGIVYAPTAQMGLVYGLLGDETKHDSVLTELRNTQIGAYHSDGKGIVAASKDGVTSGWGYTYDAVLNVGTTSWYIALERGFNPLWSQNISYRTPNSQGVVTGIVTLEGRTDDTTQATFLVTLPGETTPIAYASINDEDKDKIGIQITLSSDGSYKLIDLPTGTYDISVKANGYLRETIEDMVIDEDAYIENIDFGPLKAGDANNDNAVDSKDSTIVDDAMGSTPGSPNWDERADINNDGIINTLDSDLVTTNLGLIGDMGKDVLGPIITIDNPAKGALAMKSPVDVTIQGKIDDASATVTVNGVSAAIDNGIYTAAITLSAASNTIVVHAEDTELNVTELTSYVTFGVTSPVLILDDFEDDINRVGEWWDENGSIVYTRHIQKDLGCDGERSLKVEYHKYAGYEQSSFGIQPDQDGITNDFTLFNQLRFWVNTNSTPLEIKVTLEDEDGGKWSQIKSSTVQGAWQEFIYDFSNSKLIDFSKVKNIVFTVNPGDDASQGNFNIDGLKLVSTKSCISVTPQAPSLSSPTVPPFYDDYTLEWTDTSVGGGTLYELWEDDNNTFDTPTIYWLSDLSINFTEKIIAGSLYCKVRSWDTLPSQGGTASLFSDPYSIVIVDSPPEIERVDSFTSSGDNDNRYERGILVNINVVETHDAPDIVSGAIHITSASTSYDSGILSLSESEDGTYWFYRWDTIGRVPADDYIVETTLQDAIGQTDLDGSQPGPDLTITLTEATAPLLSKLVETTDLSYPGRGMSVKITRTHDHTLQDEEPFGKGWTHSYNVRLKEYPDGNVDFVMGNGKETTFKPVGDGTYTNKPGMHDKLTKNPDGTYKITKKDKTVLNFDTSGKLLSMVDTNNNIITLAYYPDDRPHTVTDPSSGVFTFVYKTWTAILESETRTYTRLDYIQDPAGRRMTYGYDEQQGYLTSARDALLNITNYGYTTDTHKLQTITYPEGGHKYFTYYTDDYGRLESEYKDNNEEKRTYIYSTTEPKLTIKDYYNKETVIYFNELGMTTSITDAYGKTTSYTWDADLNRTGIKDPENNETTFTYDDMGNLLTVTRKKDSVFYTTTYTYNPMYNKLETITDTKSRPATEFSYDPVNGNLLTITNKIPASADYLTTFIYDSYGQLETKTDAKNHITRYTYYNNGLPHEE
ncbi:MAG: right-handed parallel beta-helix repeat-containing protein, partial [Candidatus Omnitrophica bacterium]|nr:right-handed parallel beta-helix repeat-containing protein [Candidatus Omnitrophota bacterium]